MPVATPSVTLRHVTSVIKKFKFEALEAAVMPIFPEISWTQMKSELVKQHKNFTATNAAQMIQDAVLRANVSDRELKERLLTLEVIEVSHYHKKRFWHGYALIGSGKSLNYMTDREIQELIEDHFRASNIKMHVRLVTNNEITYLSIREQKKNQTVQRPQCTFFALFLGQNYFFCGKKTVSPDLVKMVANSIGYTNSKQMKLSGRNLLSLSKLYWRKKQGALNPDTIDRPPLYADALPEIKRTGVNCTQHRQRKKYAGKCFGVDPPTLETLVVNGPNQPWRSEEVSSKLKEENMDVSWEYRSHDIAKCLTNLIERRILATPVPNYISNLMILGKNQLTLKND